MPSIAGSLGNSQEGIAKKDQREQKKYPNEGIEVAHLDPPVLDLHTYLDASRVEALDHLFNIRGHQGIDLFRRLLACALGDSRDESSSPARAGYAAMMSAQSIQALGLLVGYRSKETMTKYVKLFTICGFVETFKIKHDRRVYLAIPSGPYTVPPTLLADLDALLGRRASRPKVKTLVRQVRDRCIAHGYIDAKALGLSLDMPSSLQHILTTLANEQVDPVQRISRAMEMLTQLLASADVCDRDSEIVDASPLSRSTHRQDRSASHSATKSASADGIVSKAERLASIATGSTRSSDTVQDIGEPVSVGSTHEEAALRKPTLVGGPNQKAVTVTDCAALSTPSADLAKSCKEDLVDSAQQTEDPEADSLSISLSTENFAEEGTDIESISAIAAEDALLQQSLNAEATWIAMELDGTKKWTAAYKKKLQQNSYLVRVSLIDMYMQQMFPDWRGVPQDRGGQWFNIRYRAYIQGQEPIPALIESWARSPYSYEQIKEALHKDRARQDQEHFYDTERLSRPYADCVQIYGYFDAGPSSHLSAYVATEQAYQDAASFVEDDQARLYGEDCEIQARDEQELHPPVIVGEDEMIVLADGEIICAADYWRLQVESELLFDCSLDLLMADKSIETEQLLQTFVQEHARSLWVSQENVAQRLAHLPRWVRQDISLLQRVFREDEYTVEALVTPRGHVVIEVRANADPTNACVVRSREDTRLLIQRFLEHKPRASEGKRKRGAACRIL